jgi:hypothetical protein
MPNDLGVATAAMRKRKILKEALDPILSIE